LIFERIISIINPSSHDLSQKFPDNREKRAGVHRMIINAIFCG
jgi:hypothetical protein